jgi:seryl-tRNA synthetase
VILMLDIKFIRENPDIVRKDLNKRDDSEKLAWFEDLLVKDKEYRELLQETERLRKRRNEISEEINTLRKQGKDIKDKVQESKELPQKIKDIETRQNELKAKVDFYLMRLPNVLHETVPNGKDENDNVVVKEWGKIVKKDFELKPHGEIITSLDIGDFDQAAAVSGRGFYYLKGDLALLEQSLIRLAVDHMVKKGYTLIHPPLMLGKEAYDGVTDLADFESVMYKIDGEDLYLIATSEHPICAMLKDKVFKEEELPLKVVGFSPCFRKEIGAHGVDQKGIYRVHQFYKIEQFVFCKPEDSWKYHEEIRQNAEEVFQALELPYRIINICTGDIGIVAAKKYDIEVWMPRQGKFGEVVSCSNCTAYQAVRSNIRYEKKDGTREYIHTLNSTALATTRAMVAIFDNLQNKDGTVDIPKALWPYMHGRKKLQKS